MQSSSRVTFWSHREDTYRASRAHHVVNHAARVRKREMSRGPAEGLDRRRGLGVFLG